MLPPLTLYCPIAEFLAIIFCFEHTHRTVAAYQFTHAESLTCIPILLSKEPYLALDCTCFGTVKIFLSNHDGQVAVAAKNHSSLKQRSLGHFAFFFCHQKLSKQHTTKGPSLIFPTKKKTLALHFFCCQKSIKDTTQTKVA